MDTPEVRWLDEPEERDYQAAFDYVELLVDTEVAEQVVSLLKEAPVVAKRARDILRASTLPLLPDDNPHVAHELRSILSGHEMPPVLLARGDNLIIADGYYRVCACYRVDPTSTMQCKLI